MKSLLRLSHYWPLAVLSLLTACVTINVYFPAAAAERAADRIIEDVWGRGEEPTPPPQSRIETDTSALVVLLDVLIPAAHAQGQANIDISSPTIERLRGSMANRHGQLGPYYDSGAVGLTGDGLIAVRDLNQVPLPQRGSVQQLVAAEQQDRNALYKAIAVENGHPEWESQIRSTFARRWVANARPGWWYQQGGSWVQK